jgi:hypothetical protein
MAILHSNTRAIGALVLVMFCLASARGEPVQPPFKLGDTLPPLAGQTVTGNPLTLPSANDTRAVVIFSFSRAGGRDAQNWAQRLSKDDPHLPLYTAIFLESVPRLFRSMAISGIRSGMPQAMQDRTLLLYQQQSFWEQRLHVTDERYASVIVLGPGGHLRWITSGPFADSLYLELRKQIRAIN